MMPMVAALRQQVTVKPGGLIEIRSPELEPGSRAEVIVLLAGKSPAAPPAEAPVDGAAASRGGWRRHAGALQGGDPAVSENDRIDADLAREYGDAHDGEQPRA